MPDTLERLSALLMRHYPLRLEQLSPDAALESLGVDSLGLVELLWNVEDAFQIQLPNDPPALATLGDVVRWVDELLARQQPAAPAP